MSQQDLEIVRRAIALASDGVLRPGKGAQLAGLAG